MSEIGTQRDEFMTFQSGEEIYGIKIEYVVTIIGMQHITALPESEDYIRGLINLRGNIIPVVDVRLRFKQPSFSYTDRTCIIVVNIGTIQAGLIVERIMGVVNIPEEKILPAPVILGRGDVADGKFVYGVGKVGEGVKLLLDPNVMLSKRDIEVIEEAENSQNQ